MVLGVHLGDLLWFRLQQNSQGIWSKRCLIEREKEEKGSCPFSFDAFGLAYAGAGAVAHGAIAFHLADARPRAVADGAVVVDLADAGAGTVADSAVAVEPADAGTTAVADGAVAFNLATTRTA